jgi:hypothetical protein
LIRGNHQFDEYKFAINSIIFANISLFFLWLFIALGKNQFFKGYGLLDLNYCCIVPFGLGVIYPILKINNK